LSRKSGGKGAKYRKFERDGEEESDDGHAAEANHEERLPPGDLHQEDGHYSHEDVDDADADCGVLGVVPFEAGFDEGVGRVEDHLGGVITQNTVTVLDSQR
jgi:hypothetical protein